VEFQITVLIQSNLKQNSSLAVMIRSATIIPFFTPIMSSDIELFLPTMWIILHADLMRNS